MSQRSVSGSRAPEPQGASSKHLERYAKMQRKVSGVMPVAAVKEALTQVGAPKGGKVGASSLTETSQRRGQLEAEA